MGPAPLPPLPPDIADLQRVAAGPINGFIAHQSAQLRREFPELVRTGPDGKKHDLFVIASFKDKQLNLPALQTRMVEVYGPGTSVDSSHASGLMSYLEKVRSSTGGMNQGVTTKVYAARDGANPSGYLHVIGLEPSLCRTCEPPREGGVCNSVHPDVMRRDEIRRFYTFSHEIGHLIAERIGFNSAASEEGNRLTALLGARGQPAAQAEQTGALYEGHLKENLSEAFTLLRTVQVYGAEGAHYVSHELNDRKSFPADPANSPPLNSYYPPASRQSLLAWAQDHVEDLRRMPLRGLMEEAGKRSPPLTPEEFADLTARTADGGKTLRAEAAQKRRTKDDYGGTLPYLKDYDAALPGAQDRVREAYNAMAEMNPYRPDSVRATALPFGKLPRKENPEAAVDMLRLSQSKASPLCADTFTGEMEEIKKGASPRTADLSPSRLSPSRTPLASSRPPPPSSPDHKP